MKSGQLAYDLANWLVIVQCACLNAFTITKRVHSYVVFVQLWIEYESYVATSLLLNVIKMAESGKIKLTYAYVKNHGYFGE